MSMASNRSTIRINLRPLERFMGALKNTSQGELNVMFGDWAERYLGFIQRRFKDYSRGGGNWPPLKPDTVRRRRKGGKGHGGVNQVKVNAAKTGGNVAILRDTNTLYRAIDPKKTSNRLPIKGGIRVGFMGPQSAMKWGDDKKTTKVPIKLTIAELAAVHQFGRGNVPRRPIIVQPDQRTVNGMIRDAKAAIRGELKKFAIK